MTFPVIEFVKKTFVLIRHFTATRLSSFTLSIGLSILRKKFARIKGTELVHIKNMFEVSLSKEFSIFIERAEIADKLWQNGLCRESINLSNEILSTLYTNYGLGNDYFPPIMGSYWTKMIGHLAFLGIHKEAQELNLVRSGNRQIFVSKKDPNMELIDAFATHFSILKSNLPNNWTDFSALWHLSERMNMVKTVDGFTNIYDLWEKVWSKKLYGNFPKSILKLDEIYLTYAEKELEKLGFDKGRKLVGLHIREEGSSDHLRNAIPKSYIPAVKYLVESGYSVVRIGSTSMSKMTSFPNFLDLTTLPNAKQNLHAYIFSKSSFFIGTNSGPASIPMLFNVPTLHTNSTSLAKNVLTQVPGSIYLPKNYFKIDGDRMSLQQLFSSFLGYSEQNKNLLKNHGIRIVDNSEEEILYAVQEIEEKIKTQGVTETVNQRVKELQREHETIGYGNFSESYLKMNESWFLQ
jgi:putative glycosyltransferase (TIGR04372 family)